MDCRHYGLFREPSQHFVLCLDMRRHLRAQSVANILWAIQQQHAFGNHERRMMETVHVILPSCQRLLSDLKPHKYTCVPLSSSKLG